MVKRVLIVTLLIFIAGCQNRFDREGSLDSKEIIERDTPLTIMGSELRYQYLDTIDAPYDLKGVEIVPKSGNIILYGDSRRVTIFDRSLNILTELVSKNSKIFSISISRDGEYLASIGDGGYLEVWSLREYRRLYSIELDRRAI